MAASLSRPDPSSPASVAEAGFSTARRGFQQDEVRAFLVAVAAELGRLQERERQLDAELREARAAAEAGAGRLDEATATELLGEETVRVLQTARESASQIKIRAEENAARILREANDEANRLRQETEVDAARRRQEAASDAEAEVALAKQQGREMVNEARAYRERVLADLDRRTTLARQQIEELIHGRDRLLQVFERARLVAVDVTSELRDIDTPDELVNLTPTTGPVPIMVPNQRRAPVPEPEPAADGADDDAGVGASDDATTAVLARPAVTGREETSAVTAETDDDTSEDVTEPHDPAAADAEPAAEDAEDDAATDADADGTADDEPVDELDDAPVDAVAEEPVRDANVVSLFRGRPAPEPVDDLDQEEIDGEEIDGDEQPDDELDTDLDDEPDDEVGHHAGAAVEPAVDRADEVGGIFARLRDELPAADTVVETGHGSADAEPEAAAELVDTAFTRRDEALVPLIVGAARKIKRVLADEQNLVLDTLRQKEPVTGLDDLVPDLAEHAATYRDAIADELAGAAAAGAAELGAADTKSLRTKLAKAGALDESTSLIRTALIAPLRERLERSIVDGGGDNEAITKRIRAVYREWKTQHIDGQLDDVFRYAHGGGLAVTVEPGTPLVWTIDPSQPACPDCEDNSLSGAVPAGESFPTGHVAAPAHPGCHCLVLPEV